MTTTPRQYGRRYDREVKALDVDGLTNPKTEGFIRVGCVTCDARPGDRCLMGGKPTAPGENCHRKRAALAQRWLDLCGALPW